MDAFENKPEADEEEQLPTVDEIIAAFPEIVPEEDEEFVKEMEPIDAMAYVALALQEIEGIDDGLSEVIKKGLLQRQYSHTPEGLEARNSRSKKGIGYNADDLARSEGDDII